MLRNQFGNHLQNCFIKSLYIFLLDNPCKKFKQANNLNDDNTLSEKGFSPSKLTQDKQICTMYVNKILEVNVFGNNSEINKLINENLKGSFILT